MLLQMALIHSQSYCLKTSLSDHAMFIPAIKIVTSGKRGLLK